MWTSEAIYDYGVTCMPTIVLDLFVTTEASKNIEAILRREPKVSKNKKAPQAEEATVTLQPYLRIPKAEMRQVSILPTGTTLALCTASPASRPITS